MSIIEVSVRLVDTTELTNILRKLYNILFEENIHFKQWWVSSAFV